ncbi:MULTISPECIES: hypothetical protein [unclassified Streptomyces]|uniref:hypothetical protein n=1 Tax=unclassified Streptomyces TaxID=2593676 RepID=UPI002E3584C7|nr:MULTISPECIES: hypothetical protein [unclassified Streptomyces]WUC62996.1 hypothetical protein OG861_01585 [Streptomyces sp. NBC_00539]
MRRTRRAAVRAAVLATTALAATLCGNVSAQGADGDGIAGYQSAQQTLRSDQLRGTVSRFLVSARTPGSAAAADGGAVGTPRNAPSAVAAPPRFELKDPVPMFEVSPELVAGKTQATPQNALRLSYLASRVTASDGHRAAVLLSPQGNPAAPASGGQAVGAEGWQLAGIRDGDTELSLAERGTPQARTFTEPQIHAWYRLTAEGLVEPLNEEATAGLGGKRSLTLAAYQKLVTARYGDKLPGSEYDRKGLAGGYDGLGEDQPAESVAAFTRPAAGASWQSAAATGAAALAAAGGAVVYARRRRRDAAR